MMDPQSHPLTVAQHYQLTRQQIPTHLGVPDKILSFWGIGVTVRQLLFLLVGWSAVANAWARLFWLSATLGHIGSLLHLGLSALPALLAVFCAYKRIDGRYVEVWALVLLRYWGQPRVYVWRSVRGEDAGAQRLPTGEDGEPEGESSFDWESE